VEHLIRYTREDVLPRLSSRLDGIRAEEPAPARARAESLRAGREGALEARPGIA
jgi:hypothetical protein